MSLKVLVVLLAAVCAAQAFAIDKPRIRSVSDVFQEIQAILDKTRDRVKDLDIVVIDFIDGAYKVVQLGADVAAEQWYDFVEGAVQGAANSGVDVSECVSDDFILERIVDKLINESGQCFAQEKGQFKESMTHINAFLESTDTLLRKVNTAVQVCSGKPPILEVSCTVGAVAPFYGQLVKLSHQLRYLWFCDILEFYASATTEILDCQTHTIREKIAEARKVVTNTLTCIKSKVNGIAF